jgi:hypothetical protein
LVEVQTMVSGSDWPMTWPSFYEHQSMMSLPPEDKKLIIGLAHLPHGI